MNVEELRFLQMLDEIVQRKPVRSLVDSLVVQVEKKLEYHSESKMAWKPLPLSIYGKELPEIIKSSWIFILRAHSNTGAERHPNSHQRMVSYRGLGDFQIMVSDRWCSNFLISDPVAPVERRWVSIPPGIWHRAVVCEENWVVVSFHTVPERDLIEERPDDSDKTITRSRKYL